MTNMETPPSLGLYPIMVILMVAIVPRRPLPSACRLSEFFCDNRRCISLSKFCDAMDDCDDGSDEPPSCTTCNRTYYGQVGVKYPYRLTEPIHRHMPFVCQLTFAAGGGQYGDVIEITFLSFQVGAFLLDSPSSGCPQGYVQVTESWETSEDVINVTRRSVGKYAERLRMSGRKRRPKLTTKTSAIEPSFGYFCGTMAGKKAKFYSERREVTVSIAFPSLTSVHSSLYLTYKFLPRYPSAVRFGTSSVPYHLGDRVPNTYCDRILRDCHLRVCKVQSPNYPGFYLRNITCHYWIRHTAPSPEGQHVQIMVHQDNEYKINVFSGYTSNDGYTTHVLTSDCASDVIRIFDGKTVHSPLLAEFCGAGALSPIISSGADMLVQLYSAPYQLLYNSRTELDVKVKFVQASELRMSKGRCGIVVDGSRNRTGVVHTPNHTVPVNTTCSFHFRSSSPTDRVWLYFLTYYVPDLYGWSDKEKCDISKLELYDPLFMRTRHGSKHHGRHSSHLLGKFCEKSRPRLCGHAMDYGDFVPKRPCLYPEESYLSSGPELLLRYSVYQNTDILHSRSAAFLARYEFVNMRQHGHANITDCDRRIASRNERNGRIASPLNLFLYGRGGKRDLSCSYMFRGHSREKLRITIERLHLPSGTCATSFDPVSRRYSCSFMPKTSQKFTALNVTENWEAVPMHVGCVCGSHPRLPLVLEALSSNVDLRFVSVSMTPEEDFNDFYFEGTYEFLPITACSEDVRLNGSEGSISFTTHASHQFGDPLRCRWIVSARPLKSLYMKVVGRTVDDVCLLKNRYLFYAAGSPRHFAAVCAPYDGQVNHLEFFSVSWANDSLAVSSNQGDTPERLVVEIVANEPGLFRVEWLEVTKPFVRTRAGETLRNTDCLYECPEIHACISEELWCDGTPHCPGGYDEVPEQCYRFPTLFVAVGASVGALLLFVALMLVVTRCCYHTKTKGSHPVPTEEVQMESTQSET